MFKTLTFDDLDETPKGSVKFTMHVTSGYKDVQTISASSVSE